MAATLAFGGCPIANVGTRNNGSPTLRFEDDRSRMTGLQNDWMKKSRPAGAVFQFFKRISLIGY
jgi:hypothetical protein